MKKHDKLCRWVISNVSGLTDLVQITLYFSTWIVGIFLKFWFGLCVANFVNWLLCWRLTISFNISERSVIQSIKTPFSFYERTNADIIKYGKIDCFGCFSHICVVENSVRLYSKYKK